MDFTATQKQIIWQRLAGLCREIGTLLLAFAPLDYSLQQDVRPATLVGFVVAGGFLFLISLAHDVRKVE